MSDGDRIIWCDRHGRAAATFACRHLRVGCGCGFHHAATDGDPWPDAWCDRCHAVMPREGGLAAGRASRLVVLCASCYEDARARNLRIPAPLQAGQLEVDELVYRELVATAYAHCQLIQGRAKRRWRLGERSRWYFDAERRTLRFYDDRGDDECVEADVDLVGSFSTETGTWMWGWANNQYDEWDRARTAPLRALGEVRGIRALAEGHWVADEVNAWEVTQIAAYVLEPEAVYRAPIDHLSVFMLLRNLRSAVRMAN